jgi:hypothetical protein
MASSVQRNNELLPCVIAGDAEARRVLIEENMALVIVKADGLVRQMPHFAYLRNDLVSAGYVGLVKAINKLSTTKPRKSSLRAASALNTWMGRAILHEMLELLPREQAIQVPRKSAKAARNPETVSWNARPINTPIVYNVLPETLTARSQFALVDLQDVCDVCCQTETERECLRLRAAGHTFKEIGIALHQPLPTAYLMFRKLQKRILKKWDCQ